MDLGWSAVAHAVAVAADDKIVVAGVRSAAPSDPSEVVLIRYSLDGSLDAGFGSGGVVTTDVGAYDDGAFSLAIQDDGKIVVGGSEEYDVSAQATRAVFLRYEASGDLDTTFGNGGAARLMTCLNNGNVFGIALQPDGRIVGAARCGGDPSVVRLGPDGTMDTSFGTDGIVKWPVGKTATVNAVLLQPDGRIVAAGARLWRLETDGAADAGFGVAGEVHADLPFEGVVLDAQGRIALVTSDIGSGSDFALSRVQPDGSADSSFGTGGVALHDVESTADHPADLVGTTDGKLIAVGHSIVDPSDAAGWRWAIMRTNVDGTLDSSFAGDGIITTRPASRGGRAHAVAVQPDHKMVVAGYADDDDRRVIAVVRYDP